MKKISVDFSKTVGKIKIMNAVNNGPSVKGNTNQLRSNFFEFKNARIPFARNHDASFCSTYGGEHTVDVHMIFPNFDADENDENNYDFFYTDKYIQNLLDAGTETYYRLGSKIEHGAKKYGTLVPKDFHKWARICEHIIAHYNEGWANGFHYNIQYWEIWNEPDLNYMQEPSHRPNWNGSKEEFIEFFITAATHLKKRFPNIKIGGASFTGVLEYVEDMLKHLQENNVQIDFFSFHCYTTDSRLQLRLGRTMRDLINKYGYNKSEFHLTEWNYVDNWKEGFTRAILELNSERGAAYSAEVMNVSQQSDVYDMLMYYDARLTTCFNGLFNLYTLKPQHAYYPFYFWSYLRELENAVQVESDDDRFTATAAVKDGKAGVMLSFYDTNRDNHTEEEFTLKLSGLTVNGGDVYITDENRKFEKIASLSGNEFTLTVKPNTVLYFAINGLEI